MYGNTPFLYLQVSWWKNLLLDDGVWAGFGCHPHFAQSFGQEEETHLRHALLNPKTIALGEIGLDYSGKLVQCVKGFLMAKFSHFYNIIYSIFFHVTN